MKTLKTIFVLAHANAIALYASYGFRRANNEAFRRFLEESKEREDYKELEKYSILAREVTSFVGNFVIYSTLNAMAYKSTKG